MHSKPQTTVSIDGDDFLVNGVPTYAGRKYRGHRVEGLLMNSRMVQATFDDRNPETRPQWAYSDGDFDAERNLNEVLAAMPTWRAHGLLALTVNFQGGCPLGYYDRPQPWNNSAFESDGTLCTDCAERMRRVIERADALGMVVILGIFYFGQDQRLTDETAVIAACDHATDWVLANGFTNVLIEIGNEVDLIGPDHLYLHEIIGASRGHELIRRAQDRSAGAVANPAGRLLVSTSFSGGTLPRDNIVEVADFVLVHGNGVGTSLPDDGKGVGDPERIREMVRVVRANAAYRGQPIVFNEDDHFDFESPDNNMVAAVSEHASWGYFDWRAPGEDLRCGYQSVPVDWSIGSDRKRSFFGLLREMTGA